MKASLLAGLRTLGRQLDSITFSHCLRVGLLAQAASVHLRMSDEDRSKFALACCFHDIGKLRIPSSILMKNSSLEPFEARQLRDHPIYGLEYTAQLGWNDSRMLETIRSHHERWDGSGYPDGLSGEGIPAWARLCAVIDAYDAMVQPRSYNCVKSIPEAMEELDLQRNAHFDSACIDLFFRIPRSTIESIHCIS
ncbi:HD-GYP domain-containing protein [Cohnella fermenti]|uniref:HD-GYP domain-containing protein n=1 Tax=Cohnella fermenti TaxID=2565925 RepID=UPI001B3B284A|nr:HD domain-containing phosphohydrolase [Cohnella fermenti]